MSRAGRIAGFSTGALQPQMILKLEVPRVQTVEDGFVSAEEQMLAHGYPAYTTSCAWLGYPDATLKQVGCGTSFCRQQM